MSSGVFWSSDCTDGKVSVVKNSHILNAVRHGRQY